MQHKNNIFKLQKRPKQTISAWNIHSPPAGIVRTIPENPPEHIFGPARGGRESLKIRRFDRPVHAVLVRKLLGER